jgi:8-oxo-dGTP diphosphatase
VQRPQGVVGVIRRGDRLLVIRRSQHVRAPGAYCFPGGAIEEGETESEALRREIREELGCAVTPLRRIWRSCTAWQVDLAWWLADLDPAAELQPNPAEVESCEWLTVAELKDLPQLLSSNRDFLQHWEAALSQPELPYRGTGD